MPALPTAHSTLAEAAGWWLEAGCACGRSIAMPCRLLARDLRPDRTIADVAGRLRCRGCGTRPERMALVDDPQLGASGRPDGATARRMPIR